MAFGKGGTKDGNQSLDGTEQELKSELVQKDIDSYEFMEPAKIRYTCTIAEGELAGEVINELALVDEDGKFTAIRTMTDKQKMVTLNSSLRLMIFTRKGVLIDGY